MGMEKAFEGHRSQEAPQPEKPLGEAADRGGDTPLDSGHESNVTFTEEEIARMMEEKGMTREQVLELARRAGDNIEGAKEAA